MRLTAVLLFLTATGAAIAQPTVGGIVNGASFVQGQAIAPGSLISIFGTQLAAAPAGADTIPLSTSLGGVTVQFVSGNTTINAPLAPLLYLQSNQINAVVPWNLLPGATTETVNVIVTNKGVASAPAPVKVGEFSPAVFSIGTLGAVQNVDGSLAQPVGSIPGRTTHPAKIGDTIIIYATGLGPVDTKVADGATPPSGKTVHTLHKPFVAIGGLGGTIQFCGLSPQFVGVYQLNVVVPNAVPGDSVPLQLALGGITSPKSITIAISQ
jgi:uncharacterized protein (TIGR03437 family)